MNGFNGFPAGKQETIIVPALFFSELLPRIDHLGEMKVTLYCLWALQKQPGEYRYVRFTEAAKDTLFLAGLAPRPDDQVPTLRDGFERCVARGTLLHLHVTFEHDTDEFYFMNTERGRQSVQALENGEWLPDERLRPIGLEVVRPSIYAIYEQTIGPLTPMIAQQLQDAVQTYSPEWVMDAMQVAVDRGVRKWTYIVAILEGRLSRGQKGAKPSQEDLLNDLKSRYSDLIEK